MQVTNAKVLIAGAQVGTYTGVVRARGSVPTRDIVFLPNVPPAFKQEDLVYTVKQVDTAQTPPLIHVIDPLSVGNKAKAQGKR